MSSKKSAQYSPLSVEASGQAVIPQSGITVTVKTVVLFISGVAVIITLLAVVAFALGAAGLAKSGVNPTAAPATPSNCIPSTSSNTEGIPTVKPLQDFVTKAECGDGQWKPIAFFDMSNPYEQCPRGWRGYSSPVRCCGRPVTDRSSCPSVFYGANGYQYSKVCGRAIGYQQGSPDGFASIVRAEPDTETVNGIYVDGVSVTHGNPRTHIWTFAVGVYERGSGINNNNNCPCDGGTNPPPFVGNNYFCETGDDTPGANLHKFYADDPLWDGQNCHNLTCCAFHNPPWFRVRLPSPTTDSVEVRICGDQRTGDEDSPLSLLELYVQ